MLAQPDATQTKMMARIMSWSTLSIVLVEAVSTDNARKRFGVIRVCRITGFRNLLNKFDGIIFVGKRVAVSSILAQEPAVIISGVLVVFICPELILDVN